MFAFLDDRLFLAQQEVTLDDVPLSDTGRWQVGRHGAKVVFHHNVVSFPKDVNMQRLVYRQAVVFDGVFYQQLEADGGNPAVCPLQLFIHIDAYGILVAHPYQVEVGCLLYTSDAADEEDSVDLGGRRIITNKKKNKTNKK